MPPRRRIGIADVTQLEHRLAANLRLAVVQVGDPRLHFAAAGQNGTALLSGTAGDGRRDRAAITVLDVGFIDQAGSVRVGTDDLAAGPRAERLKDQARWRIARRTVGVHSQVTGDVPDKVHRAIGEQDIGTAGVEARRVVESAVAVGVRIEQMAMGLHQARGEIGRVLPRRGTG